MVELIDGTSVRARLAFCSRSKVVQFCLVHQVTAVNQDIEVPLSGPYIDILNRQVLQDSLHPTRYRYILPPKSNLSQTHICDTASVR